MRFLKTALMAMAGMAVFSTGAMAQGTAPVVAGAPLPAIGIGMVIIGAAIGIGWLTRSAVESMARQPEIASTIQTAMIISAALIEGVSFFALILIGFIIKG